MITSECAKVSTLSQADIKNRSIKKPYDPQLVRGLCLIFKVALGLFSHQYDLEIIRKYKRQNILLGETW